jgi:hypothetical protein
MSAAALYRKATKSFEAETSGAWTFHSDTGSNAACCQKSVQLFDSEGQLRRRAQFRWARMGENLVAASIVRYLEHNPKPVFGKHHAQTKS